MKQNRRHGRMARDNVQDGLKLGERDDGSD